MRRVGAPPRAGERACEAGEPGPFFRPPAAAAPVVLPLRLHAGAVEDLLDRLPPAVDHAGFDARHVRATEPGAHLSLSILAAYHGVEPPPLPVPADALVPPVRVADPLGAATLFERLGGAAFTERLEGWGWRAAEARRVATMVGELARNALEHAAAPVWVAAWRTAPGELRVAVADAGIGLARSLGVSDERAAVLKAATEGGSGTGDPGRGRGLVRLGTVVGAWGGRLHLRSRTVSLSGAAPWRDPDVRVQLPFLPGLQVELVLPSPPPRHAGWT